MQQHLACMHAVCTSPPGHVSAQLEICPFWPVVPQHDCSPLQKRLLTVLTASSACSVGGDAGEAGPA